jgi:hypothetical protein
VEASLHLIGENRDQLAADLVDVAKKIIQADRYAWPRTRFVDRHNLAQGATGLAGPGDSAMVQASPRAARQEEHTDGGRREDGQAFCAPLGQ